MTYDTKQFEILSYKPDITRPMTNISIMELKKKQSEQPTNISPATLGFNSHVIKPGTRVNKAEVKRNYYPLSCDKPEQPNQNLIIIEQAEGATKVILELLNQLEPNNTDQRGDVQGCIWTLEGWLKNNLKHLKKAFE